MFKIYRIELCDLHPKVFRYSYSWLNRFAPALYMRYRSYHGNASKMAPAALIILQLYVAKMHFRILKVQNQHYVQSDPLITCTRVKRQKLTKGCTSEIRNNFMPEKFLCFQKKNKTFFLWYMITNSTHIAFLLVKHIWLRLQLRYNFLQSHLNKRSTKTSVSKEDFPLLLSFLFCVNSMFSYFEHPCFL